MFQRKKSGSLVCRSCGNLVGAGEERCYHCGCWNPGLWGFAPLLRRMGTDLGFVQLVTFGCGGLYLASLLYDPANIRTQGLSFLSPSTESLFVFGMTGAWPVFFFGRWWTLLSAGWLHGGLLHILFNMMWVRQLAPPTADIYGPARMIIIYTLSSISGFMLSTWAGAFLPSFLGGGQFTIGASAAIFGLLGALVYSGRRGGSSAIRTQALTYAVILFIFGFIMSGIDNWAHLGGFGGGYATALLLDPMKPERLNHLIVALACLVLTALSIAVSILTGMRLA